jgi:hypothetical protein
LKRRVTQTVKKEYMRRVQCFWMGQPPMVEGPPDIVVGIDREDRSAAFASIINPSWLESWLKRRDFKSYIGSPAITLLGKFEMIHKLQEIKRWRIYVKNKQWSEKQCKTICARRAGKHATAFVQSSSQYLSTMGPKCHETRATGTLRVSVLPTSLRKRPKEDEVDRRPNSFKRA